MTTTDTTTSVGERFVRAIAARDFDAATALLDPQVDFRALTPSRFWTADAPAAVGDILNQWFEPGDAIDELLGVQTDEVSDCSRVAYRLGVSNEDGPFVVEQQAYYEAHNGAISWIRMLCSGW